jgi:hypothetical protein
MSLKRMSVLAEPLEPDAPLGRVTAVHGSVVDIAFVGGLAVDLGEQAIGCVLLGDTGTARSIYSIRHDGRRAHPQGY